MLELRTISCGKGISVQPSSQRGSRRRPPKPEQRSYKKKEDYGPKDYSQGKKNKHVPDLRSFFIVNTIFKDPIYRILFRIKHRPWFRWPADKIPGDFKSRRDTSERCSYHKDWGHMTENCESYKRFLEEKVTEGLLEEFIEKVPNNREAAMELEYDQPPRGVI